MKYVLGYDLGTSYIKAAVVDESGSLRGLGRGRTPKQTAGKVVTLAPRVFREAIAQCTAEALAQAGVAAPDIAGISYASQANTFLLVDEAGEALTDLYIWTTIFDETLAPELRAFGGDPEFYATTGVYAVGAGFLPSKLAWLRRNRSDIWVKTARVLTISDYLLFGLTGTAAADSSTAALLGLLDIRRQQWWTTGMEHLGIDPDLFSAVHPMGTAVGTASGPEARRLGFSPDIPVFAGGLDHVVAAGGAGLGTIADMSESTGTVLACVTLREGADCRGQVLVGPAAGKNLYSYLTFSNAGAEVIEEYHACCASELTIDKMLAEGRRSPPGAAGLRYDDALRHLPLERRFVVGEGPAFQDRPRSDCILAIAEAIADRLRLLAADILGDKPLRRIVATGGANRSIDLLQVKADFFGAEVLFCEQRELGAFGAALLAAVGCGWFPSVRAAQEAWVRVLHRVEPDERRHQAYREVIASRR